MVDELDASTKALAAHDDALRSLSDLSDAKSKKKATVDERIALLNSPVSPDGTKHAQCLTRAVLDPHGPRLGDPEVLLDELRGLRDVEHARRRDVLGYATAAIKKRGAKAVHQTAVAPPSLLTSI